MNTRKGQEPSQSSLLKEKFPFDVKQQSKDSTQKKIKRGIYHQGIDMGITV